MSMLWIWLYLTGAFHPITLPLQFITIEHARSIKERSWGLMQRNLLPDHHGMLFHFPKEGHYKVWMYNCLIPLSIAFISKEGEIKQIEEMPFSPEYIPKKPPRNLEELEKISPLDPIVLYHRRNAVGSRDKVMFALEMPRSWFTRNRIRPGDFIVFHPEEDRARIVRPVTPCRN